MLIDTNGNQLGILDLLNLLGFLIGILNLEENLTQGDKQDIMQSFDTQTKTLLDEIHKHLESQDFKLDDIIKRLEVLEHDKNKKVD